MPVAQKPKDPERLRGEVSEELVRRGTASEHQAVVLHTEDGEGLILQRIGGNPFDDDDARALIGRTIVVEGHRTGRLFRYLNARDDAK